MATPLKILIVEDNANDAEIVLRQLRRDGYEPEWERVENASDYEKKLNSELQLILSDFHLPQFSGLEALEILRKSGLDIPFILVSGTIGEDLAVGAMQAGATDYLLKDRLTRLGTAIDHGLNQARLRKEQRKAVADLKLFRLLFDQSNDALEVIEAATGRFLDVNEKGHLGLGYTRAEFLALKLFDIDPTLDPSTWPHLVANIRTSGSASGAGFHIRKDGTRFPVEFSAKLISLDREYIVTVVRDVTERKEMEARFFRAQRLEAIGSLASGIAHDMNNILAPILMSAPLLRLELSKEEIHDTLATIETCAQRGSDLVKQLLTFGRGVEGARRAVRPDLLVREMGNIATQTFSKSVTVIQDAPKDVWPVIGDLTQLHQVLLNLTLNARDAMPKGGTLSIVAENAYFNEASAATTSGAKPGPYVVFRISDTGTGIPPDIIDKIFDPFFTTKLLGKGTGLGLSTAIGIVKSHGGFITLRSDLGKGTTFEVYLPATPKEKEPVQQNGPTPAPRGEGELVMVVDDEPKIREIIRDLLVKYGYRVVLANDGAEATMEYARTGKEIKVVITDLEMPVMDGVTLIQVLKKMNPSVSVVVSSGIANMEGMETKRRELELLGVKTILSKPYTVEDVLHVLADIRSERNPGA
jgi:two-component system, cell cycle sensor histidine kinase and response regulator CckA